MRIFITGASGWIGSAAVDDFLAAGHDVLGLVRSTQHARTLAAAGATALIGDLDDLDSLRQGATNVDAVVHLANKHDWGNPLANNRTERAAVEAMLNTVSSGTAFLVANGLSDIVAGRPVLESDASPARGPDSDRGGSENLVLDTATQGVRAMAIRFAPSVHGFGDWGFISFLAGIARERGVSAYIGDGATEWSAVHRLDAARLIRLGIENAPAGTRLHAVAEQAITTKQIAQSLGTALDLPVTSLDPVDAEHHFGFMGHFFGLSMTGHSEETRARTGWQPSGPTLIGDILAGAYCDDAS